MKKLILDLESLKNLYWDCGLTLREVGIVCGIGQKTAERNMKEAGILLRRLGPRDSSGPRNHMYGKHHSEETKERLRESNSGEKNAWWGRPLSKEHREKIRVANMGHPVSQESRVKMSRAKLGERCHCWRGGTRKPYGKEFNTKLKESIRKRDDYLCQRCYLTARGHCHHVHHIDFDNTNNNQKNLITLCLSCHSKTTIGNRDYWVEFYQSLQAMRGIK